MDQRQCSVDNVYKPAHCVGETKLNIYSPAYKTDAPQNSQRSNFERSINLLEINKK